MDPLKKIRESREKRKAQDFFESFHKVKLDPKQRRKIHAIMAARLRSFFDSVFVEGAKFVEATADLDEEAKKAPKVSSFRKVSAISGGVWVFLDQESAQQVFDLGRRYQLMLVSKEGALELCERMAISVQDRLELEMEISPLQFLFEKQA